ncbi:lauroyl acyltransferase [Thalassospira sp. ER-Se-21-Dark]|uniref:LpxL/LpxP family acyltransferase n=1 Tax=Thalassospira sp. ER-Se-21-Dark TaxID=2585190 RepID=UPI001B3142D3|nr:lauroyl acyltransferase [Thalassospira sp. ER-Se-21-Dark]MBP3126957.1 lauroyl acyltransferase [Thalassospira sp. ER-Se-21-Dark]
MDKNSQLYKMRQKYISHPLQGFGAYLVYWMFALMPVDMASAVGGWLMRTLGPKVGQTKKARNNLVAAFPEKSPEEVDNIIVGMWDNLGRSAAEIPHLHKMRPGGPRIEIVGIENGLATKTDEKPGLFFSGHIGNWEATMCIAEVLDMDMMSVYRAPDNPWVEGLFMRARKTFKGKLVKKGPEGARKLTRYLKDGGHACMLVDQKMTDGIAVPFFGRDAMTAPALAQFALKYDAPIIPVRSERLNGAHFRVTFYPPLEVTKTGDRRADTLAIMTDVNATMEHWIRERPEQWLWLHRRWPK